MEVRVAPKILIVDDNAFIRKIIRTNIEQNTNWRVCGEAENGKDAIQQVTELNPNIVILDWQMPIMNGLDAGREIARISPNTILVMFTMHLSEELVRIAHATGFREVVSKSASVPNDLLSTIRMALRFARFTVPA